MPRELCGPYLRVAGWCPVTRANRAYELRVTRDTVEVVEIASGEVVLFWDTVPGETRRLARALRADLVRLEPEAFVERWRAYAP